MNVQEELSEAGQEIVEEDLPFEGHPEFYIESFAPNYRIAEPNQSVGQWK